MSDLGALILLANIGILALNLKLYTEFFKQRVQDKRKGENAHE